MPSLRHAALAALLVLAACGGSSKNDQQTNETNLFPNSDFEGAIENVWTLYDNGTIAGGANATSSIAAVDCTADGFTGKCLKISADSYAKTAPQLWDAALELKDGVAAGPQAKQITIDPAKSYEITFKARASIAGAKFHLAFQTPTYAEVKAMDFTLTTTAADYTTGVFSSTNTPGTLAIQLGYAANAGATFEIDDLKLIEK